MLRINNNYTLIKPQNVLIGSRYSVRSFDLFNEITHSDVEAHCLMQEEWVTRVLILPKKQFASTSISIKIWKIVSDAEFKCLRELTDHSDKIWDIKYVGRSTICSCSRDKTIRVYNYEDGTHLRKMESVAAFVKLEVLSLEEELILSSSIDRTFRIWSWRTGVLKKTFRCDEMVFSLSRINRNLVLVGLNSKKEGPKETKLQIWNVNNERIVKEYFHGKGRIYSTLVLSEDYFLSGGEDGSIKLFKIKNEFDNKEVLKFGDHKDLVDYIDCYPGFEGYIFSCSMNDGLKFFNLHSRKCVNSYEGDCGSFVFRESTLQRKRRRERIYFVKNNMSSKNFSVQFVEIRFTDHKFLFPLNLFSKFSELERDGSGVIEIKEELGRKFSPKAFYKMIYGYDTWGSIKNFFENFIVCYFLKMKRHIYVMYRELINLKTNELLFLFVKTFKRFENSEEDENKVFKSKEEEEDDLFNSLIVNDSKINATTKKKTFEETCNCIFSLCLFEELKKRKDEIRTNNHYIRVLEGIAKLSDVIKSETTVKIEENEYFKDTHFPKNKGFASLFQEAIPDLYTRSLQYNVKGDITLCTNDGGSFEAHRDILIVRSPYFHRIFNEKDVVGRIITIEHLSETQLKYLLDFYYLGRLDNDDVPKQLSDIVTILLHCDKYLEDDIKWRFIHYFHNNVEDEESFELKVLEVGELIAKLNISTRDRIFSKWKGMRLNFDKLIDYSVKINRLAKKKENMMKKIEMCDEEEENLLENNNNNNRKRKRDDENDEDATPPPKKKKT